MQLPCELEFMGRRYRINTAFDTVLRVFALQRDELFTPTQRITLTAEILAGKRAAKLDIESQVQFVEEALSMIVGEGRETNEPKLLDFEQDAPYIYAAFLSVYGLDLYKMAGYGPRRRARLDWRQFIALFMGLPDDTKIKEIMHIRRRPIPESTKHNAAQIKALIEAKTFYALRFTETEAEIAFQRGVDRLAAGLAARASKPRQRR